MGVGRDHPWASTAASRRSESPKAANSVVSGQKLLRSTLLVPGRSQGGRRSLATNVMESHGLHEHRRWRGTVTPRTRLAIFRVCLLPTSPYFSSVSATSAALHWPRESWQALRKPVACRTGSTWTLPAPRPTTRERPPDSRSVRVGAAHGVHLNSVARQVTRRDFDRFDVIVAMDRSNRRSLERTAPGRGHRAEIVMMRDYDPRAHGPRRSPRARPRRSRPLLRRARRLRARLPYPGTLLRGSSRRTDEPRSGVMTPPP